MKPGVISLVCCGVSALADGPVRLVGVPDSDPGSGLGWGTMLNFGWMWIGVLVTAGVAFFLMRRLVQSRAVRLDPSGAGFRMLCRGLGLNAGERKAIGALARAHGVATPAGIVLSASAFETAARLLGDERARKNIERVRVKLGY